MPPPSTSDWPAIKATAIARNSIKEAAELHGVTYESARMRASREQWPVGRRPAKAVQQAKQLEQAQLAKINPGAVTAVTSTSDALVSALANDSSATRIGFSKAARKVAEHTAGMEAPALLDKDTSQAVKHWSGVAAQVHGWDAKADAPAVMVNVALLMG